MLRASLARSIEGLACIALLTAVAGCRATSAPRSVGAQNANEVHAGERGERGGPRAEPAEPAEPLSLASATRAPQDAPAADDAAELAKKLSNPVADLISVPFQGNWDTGIGPADADRTTINVQPVIPFGLNPDWNGISRTILPIIDAQSPVVGGEGESGIGDVLQSLFLSPKEPSESGWIVGFGPALLFPTASEDSLGSSKWAAGPTVVVLKQSSGWTYGALANHLWSYAGESSQPDVNATFVQPFLAFTTSTHTTLTLNTESTYDWNADQWTVPVNAVVSQLLEVGKLPISVGIGYREFVETPEGGPDWGLRFILTFLFPR